MERERIPKREAVGGLPVLFLLKCLLVSYILTGGLLMLLALFVYRFSLSEKLVSVVIFDVLHMNRHSFLTAFVKCFSFHAYLCSIAYISCL